MSHFGFLLSNRRHLLGLMMLVAFTGGGLSARGDSRPQVGFVVSMKGAVLVSGVEVKKPGPVFEGAKVQTKKGANCTLLIGREVVLHLAEETEILLSQAEVQRRRAEFTLGHGKIRALVRSNELYGRPKEFQKVDIRTRAVTLGVRGTQFTVDSPIDPLLPQRFTTLEGQVALTIGNRLSDSVGRPNAESAAPVITLEKGQSVEIAGGENSKTDEGRDSGKSSRPNESGSSSDAKPKPIQLTQARLDQEKRNVIPPPPPMATLTQLRDPFAFSQNASGALGGEAPQSFASLEGGMGAPMGGGYSFGAGGGWSVPLDPIVDGGSDSSVNSGVSITIEAGKQP